MKIPALPYQADWKNDEWTEYAFVEGYDVISLRFP
jgi:hypothetical protein